MADWQAIKTEYEAGASLRSLAAKHNVSKTYIIEKRNKQGWTVPTTTDRPDATQGSTILTRDANAAVRVAAAIKCRQQGWTYQRIAAQCGYYDASDARKAIQRELNTIVAQSVEEWRNDHMARLEKLHEEVWELAMDKTNKGRLFAVDRLLVIAERQAKLLNLDVRPDEMMANVVVVREVPTGYLGVVEAKQG